MRLRLCRRGIKGLSIAAGLLAAGGLWSQTGPNSPAHDGHIRRASLWPRLGAALAVFGDRLEKPGRERGEYSGTLARGNANPVPLRVYWELPGRCRVEESRAGGVRTLTFNGAKSLLPSGADESDENLLEMLVNDTPENFFVQHATHGATRLLGTGFRLDDGRSAAYSGPYYDIYEQEDAVRVHAAPRQTGKLYFVNSATALVERVSYRVLRNGRTVRVDTVISGWGKVGDLQAPRTITREEDGQPVFTFSISSAAFGPQSSDGIFDQP